MFTSPVYFPFTNGKVPCSSLHYIASYSQVKENANVYNDVFRTTDYNFRYTLYEKLRNCKMRNNYETVSSCRMLK